MSLIHEVKTLFQYREGLTSKHDSWEEIELAKVVEIQNGYAFKSNCFNNEGKGYPLIRIRDILNGNTETYYDGIFPKEYMVATNDLLVGMDGDFNSDLWKGKPSLLNQRVCRLIPNESFVLKKFLAYGIGGYLKVINDNTSSTTVKHLSSKSIGEIPFPLPPLPEQQRIVAKLDSLFARIEKLKASMERIPQLLKDFRQAVLTQAVTGNTCKELEDYNVGIQTGPFGSALHKEDYVLDGTPVINPSHILDGKIIPDGKVTINDQKLNELRRWILEDGDIILGRRGEMGRAAVYRDVNGTMLCGTGSVVLKRNDNIDSDFLAFLLRSKTVIEYLNSNSVGSTMINLNQKIIRSIPMPGLDIVEQRERIRGIETLFAKADRIEAQYQSLKEKLDALPQALLAKAFRGELVEQIPTDGDARELLAEIKKLRNAQPKHKLQTGEELNVAAEPRPRYAKR